MTQSYLREKVIKAEAKVAKRTAVLQKHREQLAKLIQKGADQFDIRIKKSDIESAEDKLEEAKKILANWKEMAEERSDLAAYVNLFGYNPKYGVRYEPQSFIKTMTRPEQTLPAKIARR